MGMGFAGEILQSICLMFLGPFFTIYQFEIRCKPCYIEYPIFFSLLELSLCLNPFGSALFDKYDRPMEFLHRRDAPRIQEVLCLKGMPTSGKSRFTLPPA